MRASVIRGQDADDRRTAPFHVAAASDCVSLKAPRNRDPERPYPHVCGSGVSSDPHREWPGTCPDSLMAASASGHHKGRRDNSRHAQALHLTPRYVATEGNVTLGWASVLSPDARRRRGATLGQQVPPRWPEIARVPSRRKPAWLSALLRTTEPCRDLGRDLKSGGPRAVRVQVPPPASPNASSLMSTRGLPGPLVGVRYSFSER